MFDVSVCDPPFFDILLARLFAAVRVPSRNDFTQALLISYLCRRSAAILGMFAPFGLAPNGYCHGHQRVRKAAD